MTDKKTGKEKVFRLDPKDFEVREITHNECGEKMVLKRKMPDHSMIYECPKCKFLIKTGLAK